MDTGPDAVGNGLGLVPGVGIAWRDAEAEAPLGAMVCDGRVSMPDVGICAVRDDSTGLELTVGRVLSGMARGAA